MSGHTGKSNYGLKLSMILMFLTIYGVEKCSVTAAVIIKVKVKLIQVIITSNLVTQAAQTQSKSASSTISIYDLIVYSKMAFAVLADNINVVIVVA